MLSRVYSPGSAVSEYWVSEKYDGVRGFWTGTQLLTRAGNAIAAPAWFIAGWPTTPMDGELWAGRGQFNQAVSTVRQEHAEDAAWRAMRYMVFDLPAHGGPFSERLPALQAAVAALSQPWVVAVEQTRGTSEPALQARLASVVQGGGEGLVLHHGAGLYLAQRSDTLRKLKPFEDAEARVVGHVPGRGKYAGQLGALWVELPAIEGQVPRRFKLGSGFSNAERLAPPPVGTWVTYRFRGQTAARVPRFATFLRAAPDRGL
jgi:DNA ligase-1